jgi:hypothetical protein
MLCLCGDVGPQGMADRAANRVQQAADDMADVSRKPGTGSV